MVRDFFSKLLRREISSFVRISVTVAPLYPGRRKGIRPLPFDLISSWRRSFVGIISHPFIKQSRRRFWRRRRIDFKPKLIHPVLFSTSLRGKHAELALLREIKTA